MSFMPVILDVDARETVHVNTGDLEDGNPTKGLAEGIGAGAGVGDWRLALHSSSRCSPTTGLMTGLLAALHDVAPHTGVRRPGANEEVGGRHVAVFYPREQHQPSESSSHRQSRGCAGDGHCRGHRRRRHIARDGGGIDGAGGGRRAPSPRRRSNPGRGRPGAGSAARLAMARASDVSLRPRTRPLR